MVPGPQDRAGIVSEHVNNIPHKWLEVIVHFLMGFRNDTVDFSRPHLRPSVATVYPLFVFLYALLVSAGTVANLAMITSIVKDKLYRDQTYCYLINIGLANIVECLLVLPVSLMILLVQNWVFGSFLCYFLPMLQQQPILEEHPPEAYLPALTTTPQPQPGSSTLNEHSLIQSLIRKVCRDVTTSFANASPQEILAIPTVEQRFQTRKNYLRGKTVVLTSSPYKIELEPKRTKKCSNPNDPKSKKNSKKRKTQKAPSGVENTDEDTMCLYCLDVNHAYLKSSEGWVACQLCERWAHTAYAGVDDDNAEEIHICLYCDAK